MAPAVMDGMRLPASAQCGIDSKAV